MSDEKSEPAETELDWETIQEIADAAGPDEESSDDPETEPSTAGEGAEGETTPDDGFPPDAPAPTDAQGAPLPVDTEGAAAAGYEFNPPAPAVPDPAPAEAVAPAFSYGSITVKTLTEILAGVDLPTTGNKPELYARAVEAGLLNGAAQGRPTSYTVVDETHYAQVAAKFNIANYRELGAQNGVKNSRYELNRGDVVQLPTPKRG